MGNWTAVIIIPPPSYDEELLEHCNAFLKEQYQGDYEPLFGHRDIGCAEVLTGNFSYFHEAEFIKHLRKWFHPVPTYEVVDKTEKPTRYLSQAYVQANRRWGTIQVVIKREHDDRFWLVNINENGAKAFGHLDVEGL